MYSFSLSDRITTHGLSSLSLAITNSRRISVTRPFQPRISVWSDSMTFEWPLRSCVSFWSRAVVINAMSIERITTPDMPANMAGTLNQLCDSRSWFMLPGSVMPSHTMYICSPIVSASAY